MTTPEPVSPAPDTDGLALRVEIAKQLARHDAELWGYDHGFTSYGSDEESDSFVTLMAKLIEQREAGLRADLDQTRDEVERLEQRVTEQHEIIQGWARYGERVKADRARFGDMLIAALGLQHEPVSRHFHRLVPQACEEIARLRVELDRVSGARPIPDDAVRLPENWQYQLGWLFDVGDHELHAKVIRLIEMWQGKRIGTAADVGATPTTGPAPAAADGTRVWFEDDPEPNPRPRVVTTPDGRERIYAEDWGGWGLRNEPGGPVDQWGDLPKPLTEVLPVASQAPAEPTEEHR